MRRRYVEMPFLTYWRDLNAAREFYGLGPVLDNRRVRAVYLRLSPMEAAVWLL